MSHHHLLLISTAAYGHLNPTIQLGKNLTRAGACVTIATTLSGINNLKSLPSHNNLSFSFFSDGHDDNINAPMLPGYRQDLKQFGSKSLTSLIQNLSKSGNHVTMVVYAFFLPWAALVARELNLPSALFLIQSATSFWIYNRFCNSRDGIVVVNKDFDASISVKLAGLPSFKWGDLPKNLFPTSPLFDDMIPVCKEHMQVLEEDPNTWVLLNTLEGLETVVDSLKSIANFVVVGPCITTSFTSDRGSYFEWLDTKEDKSVVYVSFGSMAVLTRSQKEELLYGLIESGRPFMAVLRDECEDEDVEIKGLKERMGENGLIVKWCSQMEVLRHRAIGCFVTHCGWNSTLESMVAGVAVVACPQFSDQTTNAKMVVEVWGNGVRALADEDMVVGRDEIKRCLGVVMNGGDRAEEIKKKVEIWKNVAAESVKDGGSLETNVKQFLESIL